MNGIFDIVAVIFGIAIGFAINYWLISSAVYTALRNAIDYNRLCVEFDKKKETTEE